MKKVNYRGRLIALYITSFIVSILPLAICLVLKRDEYFKTVGESVKLAAGGIILLFLLVVKILGKFKMPGRMTFFFLLFILSYLLESLLTDLALLSGMALLGEALDYFFLSPFIKKTREDRSVAKAADVTSQKVEEIIKKYSGGRV